jgi:deoxyuridine 5'-triphosphate nucleotidohydrolase
MSLPTYRLELLVTEQGTPYDPNVGSIEHPSSDNAGYDLKVVVDQTPCSNATLVPLGVKARMLRNLPVTNDISIVEGCHFSLEPRSSIYKSGFMMANSRGIIDSSYRGELMAPLISVGSTIKSIEAGTRLFQIIAPDMGHISEVVYVSALPDSSRGSGGFGSTGLK